MKTKKQLRVFLIVALILISIFAIFNKGWSIAGSPDEIPELDNSYVITNYDFDMVVNEDNTVDVVEVITTKFSASGKHGIYRNIPLSHTMEIEENGKTKKVTQMIEDYNVTGNHNAVFSHDDANLVIRFGSEYEFMPVDEEVTFAMSYTLDLGRDYAETFDMLYYNIVGSGWQVPINNFDYSITMPKEFDASKITMYRGRYGETTKTDGYIVEGNVISGNATNFVVGEALTISLVLPENYFSLAETITYKVAEVAMYMAVAVLVVVILLLILRTPKEPMVSPVEFYPPDGMNPVQIASIVRGKATVGDMTSLIVYYASKKYIKIKKAENNHIILTKVKHINPREKNYVKKLFERLFATCDTVDISGDMENDVKVDYIDKKGKRRIKSYDGLSTEIYECTNLANENKPVKNRFDKKNRIFSIIGVSLVFIAIMTYLVGYSVSILFFELLQLIFMIASLGAIYTLMLELGIHRVSNSRKGNITNTLLLIGYVAYFVLMMIFSFETISYTMGYTQYVTCLALMLATMISAFTLTYSKKQSKLLGKVLGFKNFLLTCEKDRMDILVKDNPEYFYDILPYAYVLGISDEFMDRFEHLGHKPPCSDYFWEGHYDRMYFHYYVNRCDSISRSAIKVQTVSRIGDGVSGGFSGGGGGFSGGGFGGGGGGSW